MDFKEEYQTLGFRLTLAAPEHQEMNRQVEVTRRMLRTIIHSRLVYARVLEASIHFSLMYMMNHILPVIPIKDMINKDRKPTTPFKLATVTNPSVSHLRVLLCPCVVQKATVHVEKKALNMRHEAQKVFRGNLVGIP